MLIRETNQNQSMKMYVENVSVRLHELTEEHHVVRDKRDMNGVRGNNRIKQIEGKTSFQETPV
jgi:hypothetical protein